MREIKFRAWDGNTMTKPFDLEWLKESTEVPDDFNKKALFNDKCIFLQSTGLKDKNNKEIYEGDIVKDVTGVISEVKYLSGWSGYFLIHKNKSQYRLGGVAEPMEIIGNIYENPQLLYDPIPDELKIFTDNQNPELLDV